MLAGNYFASGGVFVSTFCSSVTVVEPAGVVTVVSVFLASVAFLSQPTVRTVARLNSRQNVMIRFISGTP